jgi:phosphotransferase system  glucose/maltose/N-acetylglucosamine-specific IIC component
MRTIYTAAFLFCVTVVVGQTVPAPQPIEEHYETNYWWWIIGVLLAIGAGIAVYMLIKKDPKRDAVR